MRRFTRLSTLPRAVAVVLVAALSVAVPARPASAQAAPDSFTFNGAGFGHGVGLSQYGAYGQAIEGRTANEILQHYYAGTTVKAIEDSVGLRVNLLDGAASAQARGEALADGGGAIRVTAGQSTLDARDDEAVSFGIAAGQVTATKAGAAPIAGAVVEIQWSGPTLLNLIGPNESFATAGHRYRYGKLDLAVLGDPQALQVVNTVNLHGEYLKGIAEMPSSWPAAALEAQVVAARTYALRKFRLGERAACRCHVFDTVADQVFAGWAKESEPSFGARWVAAVSATSPSSTTGVVVMSGDTVISANYFSSSGGKTETNVDGFGSSTQEPYLRSVDDRWSMASYNPFSAWSFTRSQNNVRDAFNKDAPPENQLTDVERIDLTARTVGGALRQAVAHSSDGKSLTISGTAFRRNLDLPARWIGTPVVRVSGADRYATSVAIAKEAVPSGDNIVVVSGDPLHLVDGLVAAPLAGVKSAPLLLSPTTGLAAVVGDEVARRKPKTAYLVGGEGALGKRVEDDLRAKGVGEIVRLSGGSRFETAAAVGRAMGTPRPVAIVASGIQTNLVDALAAGGPGAATGRPILLVTRDEVPLATRQVMAELGVTSTVVVGGQSSISDTTAAQLPAPVRVAGNDRYGTAVAIANHFLDAVGIKTIAVASGADLSLVDSLAGGALKAITLLTEPAGLTGVTKTWLAQGGDMGAVDVLGGPAAISNSTFDTIRSVVYP